MKLFTKIVLASTLLASQMGHGGGCCSEESSVFGPPTESTCPSGSTLTYNNFGKQFVETYCTRCHASDKMGAARNGAPAFHDFDSLFGIMAVSAHIDEVAAAGPAATNEGMPPSSPKPTLAERQMLGEWIACGMPEQ
jgi:uncharacterized membrane protein